MELLLHTLELSTTRRDEIRDITREVASLIEKSGVQQGTALVYCPHTTAGIAINENADPDVKHDVMLRLDEVYPWEHPQYRHMEGNTASHLKSITTGPHKRSSSMMESCCSDDGRDFIFVNSTDHADANTM